MLGVGGRTFYDRIIVIDDPVNRWAFIFTTLLPEDRIADFRSEEDWKQDTEGFFTGVAETLISIQAFTYQNPDKSGLEVVSYNQLDCRINIMIQKLAEAFVPRKTLSWLTQIQKEIENRDD